MRTPDQLTKGAWEVIDSLMEKGSAVLPSGKVLAPEDKVLVDLARWLANLQGRPKKTPKAMDDWKPQETA